MLGQQRLNVTKKIFLYEVRRDSKIQILWIMFHLTLVTVAQKEDQTTVIWFQELIGYKGWSYRNEYKSSIVIVTEITNYELLLIIKLQQLFMKIPIMSAI